MFDPYCSCKDFIIFSSKTHTFYSVSESFKKLNLGHYSLTDIVLSKILYKFPPKAYIVFDVQKFTKKCIRDNKV